LMSFWPDERHTTNFTYYSICKKLKLFL
jgi:hypothetical protein